MTLRSFIGAMATVATLTLLSTVGAAQQAALPSPVKPTAAVQTYFFVGGKYVKDGERQFMSGQMYVQQFSPVKVTHRWPVVMIHGTAQTGNNFLGTPDGRQGWANDFLAKGFSVYIVDQVGRARWGAAPESYGSYMRFCSATWRRFSPGRKTSNSFPKRVSTLNGQAVRELPATRHSTSSTHRKWRASQTARRPRNLTPRRSSLCWRRSVRLFCSPIHSPAFSAGRWPTCGRIL